ncbi:glycosyltransferase family 2 protein [bacterium]|nr:glycosyltransferase family 2 protein [candidate division CSSED10-310 bacterium]
MTNMTYSDIPIAVLFFNKLNLTMRCIQSLCDAGYSKERLYVFDNGSTSDMTEILKERFTQINTNRSIANTGFSGGFNHVLRWIFNLGFSSAFFLTNDTMALPGLIEECRTSAVRTGAGIIAPCITVMNQPEKIDSIGAYVDRTTIAPQHYRSYNLGDFLDGPDDYIPGTALWIDRNSFYALNGADETYHTYWEDIDMCFRARKLGIRMARCYSARLLHGIGQTCHKKPLYTTYFFQRNRIRFCRQHLNASEWLHAKRIILEDLAQMKTRFQSKGDRTRLGYLEKLYAAVSE